MKLLTYLAHNGPRIAILTNAGVEDVVPETGDAYAVISASGVPRTNGKPKPLDSVHLLAPIAQLKRPVIAIDQGDRNTLTIHLDDAAPHGVPPAHRAATLPFVKNHKTPEGCVNTSLALNRLMQAIWR
jgi:hypothetical protein